MAKELLIQAELTRIEGAGTAHLMTWVPATIKQGSTIQQSGREWFVAKTYTIPRET